MLFHRILFTLNTEKLMLLTIKTDNRLGKRQNPQYHIETDENT